MVQQLDSLLRWSMTWLTERLPPLCPVSLGTEWVDMVSSSHNKHFSKWASSDDNLGHIECPTVFSSPSLWSCCPTKTLLCKCVEGGHRKRMFLEDGADIIQKSNVLSILCTAGHTRLPQAATKIFTAFTPNHYVVTSVLVSHMALYVLMHVVTTTYCFTRVCPSTCKASPIN